MTIGLGSSLVLLAWGGLCSADQRAIGSRQIHQPLVAAVIAGWILGAPERGLLIGLWLQLVWPAPMPVGGAPLPDTGSVAVAGAVLASAIPGGEGFLIAILFGLLAAWFSVPWERWLRSVNGRVEEQALASGGVGLDRAIARGIAGPFLRGAAYAALALLLARVAVVWIGPLSAERAPGALTAGLIGGAGALGLAGLLSRAQTETGRSWWSWAVAGGVLGATGRLLLEASR